MSDGQLDAVVRGACVAHADRVALSGPAGSLTYAQLADAVARRAEQLDDVLRHVRVDRVGLYAANSVDYVVSYLAVLRTDRVPLLVDAEFGEHELAEIRSGCGVTVFLADRDRAARVVGTAAGAGNTAAGTRTALAGSEHEVVHVPGEGAPPPLHRDTAVCRFTSGSTGVPKCLEFSHAAVVNAARNWVEGAALTGDDRTLCLAAFTNGLAFNTSLLSSFLVGARLHVHRGLPTSAKIVAALAESRATRLVAFPAVYRVLVQADLARERLAGLRMAISAGAPLPPQVRAAFEERFGVRIADYYGIAETGPCTFERDPAYRTGLGTPLPGVTLRVVENADGQPEVHVRSTSMATRYLNVPGALERARDAEGFYASGDIGHLRDDRLFVTGRVGGPINLAGRKIDPREVEQAIAAVDGVRDVVVFADRDADDQVFLHAAVAADGSLRRADVIEGCRGRLAPFKAPQKVTFVPHVPRSSPGKVRMTDLLRLVRDVGAPDGPRADGSDPGGHSSPGAGGGGDRGDGRTDREQVTTPWR